jgi:hypothetical protein
MIPLAIRDQAPARRLPPPAPPVRPRLPLAGLATPPPGPLMLVPPAHPTRRRRRDYPGQLAHGGYRIMLAPMGPQLGSSGKSEKRPSGMSDTVKGAIVGALGAVVAAVLTAIIGHSAGIVYIGALPSPSQVPTTSLPSPIDPGSTAIDPGSTATVGTAAPLYTAPFTVHGPNAGTCNIAADISYVSFSSVGPVVNPNSGGADLNFDCSASGVPEMVQGLSGIFTAVHSKPDASTCVSAAHSDPIPALALRDMTSGMWLCVDNGSLVIAMQLQTPPSQAATTGVVSFTASAWPA